MKVVGTDNWGRDYNGGRSEKVYADNCDQKLAEQLAKRLNAEGGPHSDTYWVVKPDDYVPYVFEGY